MGVFKFELSDHTMTQLFPQGFTFQSASPDGKHIIISQDKSLYISDGSTLILISDSFFDSGSCGALWLPDGRIVVILEKGLTTELAVFQADGSGKTLINLEAAPIWIYPTTDGDRNHVGKRDLYFNCSMYFLRSLVNRFINDPNHEFERDVVRHQSPQTGR